MERRRMGPPLPESVEEALDLFEGTARRTEQMVEQTVEGIADDLKRPPRRTPTVAIAEITVEPSARRRSLREMIHSRESLRNAILMSEILGPPKGLR